MLRRLVSAIGFVLLIVALAGGTTLLRVQAQDDAPPRPKGDRRLAIDVREAEGEEYDTAFLMALEMGMQEIGLSLDWADLEPAPQSYDTSLLEIANVYYPAYGVPLTLTLRPIHTHTLRVPDDLRQTAFDDPAMIDRFTTLLDVVFATMPDVDFAGLIIGSEFDAYLGADAGAWAAYTTFAAATADYARQQRPGIPVAFEAMYPAFIGDAAPYLAELNAHADLIGVSYYPIRADGYVEAPSVVADAFATLVAAYPDQPIALYQYGYPSSEAIGSSEALQAGFIRESFAAWDTHADQIAVIDFTWLTDMSAESVAFFEDYYSYSTPEFRAFLGSLGLRYADGTPKTALATLRDEAAARGW